MAVSEKEKALQTALAQIEKQFGKGAVMKLGQNSSLNVEAIPTGSLSLDIALGIGGVPRGRIIEIYGPESSGKTTVALHIVAEAQKMGGEAVFIDVEHALDPVYAQALGVDTVSYTHLASCQRSSATTPRCGSGTAAIRSRERAMIWSLTPKALTSKAHRRLGWSRACMRRASPFRWWTV